MTVLHFIGVLFCAFWIYALIYMHLSVSSMPKLAETAEIGVSTDAPALSVIVPARNEETHIRAALASLQMQDYPELQLIVVNDRSTDSTGAIIDETARTDSRIVPVHIDELPTDWLGKVHALHRGLQAARGDWYLFTDADIYFSEGTLRRAVLYAQERELDHVACLPELETGAGFWLDTAIRSFFLLFCMSAKVATVNKGSGGQPIGVGAFNLVKATAFRRTPGFEWLRMEPADDVGLGVMLKNTGAQTRLLNADGVIRVPWYESIGAMIRGLEKNSFGPGAHYSYLRQAFIAALMLGLATVPALSFIAGLLLPDPILLGAGGVALSCSACIALIMPRKSNREILSYLLMPAGVLLVAWIMLRAAYLCWRNDGIDWRGTRYPLAELRRNQRVKF